MARLSPASCLHTIRWLTPTVHLALGPGLELMVGVSPLTLLGGKPPSVCEMRLVRRPLRVGKEFLEEEPAGLWVWAPHPHAWLAHTPSLFAAPILPAPSSLQALSEVWKQERVSPDPVFFSLLFT